MNRKSSLSVERRGAARLGLAALLVIHLVFFLFSLLSWLPISGPNGWIYWARKVLTVLVIVVLFLLDRADPAYLKAAGFRLAAFLISILTLIGFSPVISLIFSLVRTVLSVAACRFEYTTHGRLVSSSSPGLTRGWRVIFYVTLAVCVLSWLLALVLLLLPGIIAVGGVTVPVATVTSTVTTVLDDIVDLIYLLLLFFTLRKL